MSGKLFLFASAVTCLWNQSNVATAATSNKEEKSSSGMRKMFQGVASYYADKFHGRRTASGERFDQTKFTCAHKYLPFGTRILVKNTRNGKTCVVTVNDRGPFLKNRILDLSKAAATRLGITGVGQVICFAGAPGLYEADDALAEPQFRTVQPEIHGPYKISSSSMVLAMN